MSIEPWGRRLRSLEVMQDPEQSQRDELPESFDSLQELQDFWDTHSSADYEDCMEDIELQVDLAPSKFYCAVEKQLLGRVRAVARQQGISAESLLQQWIKEKLAVA